LPLLFVVVVARVVVPLRSFTVTPERPGFVPSAVPEPSLSIKTVPEIVADAVAE